MEKVGKPTVLSVALSAVIYAFCRYVDFHAMADHNKACGFSAAFMFGISFSALIWAHETYRRSDFRSDEDTGLIRWFKEMGIFPCFSFTVYYFTVMFSQKCRAGLIVGLVLCSVEFERINFTQSYYPGFVFWFMKISLMIVLMYVAVVTVPQENQDGKCG
ncbi:MAG: hypothetical protein NC086_06400 [Alistipes sp.]|nr:hypothetical protein [Alistipes sp.]